MVLLKTLVSSYETDEYSGEDWSGPLQAQELVLSEQVLLVWYSVLQTLGTLVYLHSILCFLICESYEPYLDSLFLVVA